MRRLNERKSLDGKGVYDDSGTENFDHSYLESQAEVGYKFRNRNESFSENRIAEKTKKRLSVKELADYLGVAPKTIYGWIYKGLIEPERIGPRLIRFDLEKIEQWILHSKETL